MRPVGTFKSKLGSYGTIMKNIQPNLQSTLYQMFTSNPIAYKPELAIIMGSVHAGLLMAQLLYWQNKGSSSEWIYKTIVDIKRETGLSRANQETAIKLIKKKGLLVVKLAGVPAKRHFKIDFVRLTALVLSLQDSGKLVRQVSPNSIVTIKPTTTESTVENTSNIKRKFFKRNRTWTTEGWKRPFEKLL